MKLTKQLEAEIIAVNNAYWNSYIKGDWQKTSSFLDDNIKMIGSTEGEVYNNKKEATEFFKTTAREVAGKIDMRNREIEIIPADPYVMINEHLDLYVHVKKQWVFYSKVRLSSLLKHTEKGWKYIQQHGSVPDAKVMGNETIAFQQITKENLELKEAVKRRTAELEQKNHELVIEAALEKVRSVVISMKEPADMLEVCRTISEQMELQNVTQIRNVQTTIINEEKGMYLNYEYFTRYKRASVVEIITKLHPAVEEFSKEMLKSKNAFFTKTLKGKELVEWREYLKKTNQDADPVLDTVDSVHYYFYSIGSGALGISSYAPLKEEHINLFKRFRNVFDFACKRFIDIALATAQAREAKIEAALERVRSRTMAMQRSEELGEAASLLFKQVSELGINVMTAGFNIWNADNFSMTSWLTDPAGNFLPPYNVPLNEFWLPKELNRAKQQNEEFLEIRLNREQLKESFDYLARLPELKVILGSMDLTKFQLPETQVDNYAFFSKGNLMFITYEPCTESHDIFKRFAKVFEQTYTRFLDLKKAEAQAREAQIEVALEKVRSRSLAMHKSDEIEEVLHAVFERLKELGIDFYTAIIILFSKDSKDIVWWLESKANRLYRKILVPYADIEYMRNLFAARESGMGLFSKCYLNEEKNELFHHLFDSTDFQNVPEEQKKFLLESEFATISVALAKNTGIHITSYSRKSFSEQDHEVLERFAKVFEQAYTRFLDLQKAETQAREAQIQLALERVRARTMAMHRSDELPETSHLLFEQLKELGEPVEQMTIGIVHEEKNVIEISATLHGDTLKKIYLHSIDEPYMMSKVYNAWKKRQNTLVVELRGDELNAYNKYRNELTNSEMFPTNNGEEDRRIVYAAFFSKGMLALGSNEPRTAGSLQLLERFASVFDLTYTRFLDLQKAEAQAKESQVQLALERVRARTMAMHKSDELADVATLLFKQISDLGIKTWTTGFNIWSDDNNFYTDYITNPKGGFIDPYTIDVSKAPIFKKMSEAKKRGDKFLVNYEEGEELEETYRQLSIAGEKQFKGLLEDGFAFPAKQYEHVVFGAKVSLLFITYEPVTEAHDIFIRFGKVFEQTYTRFLDLQKAEAQARESEIQLALERVRARTMAMQKSDEFSEAVFILFNQFKELGEKPDQATIGIIHEKDWVIEYWVTMYGNQMDKVFKFSIDEPNVTNRIYKSWKEKKKSLVIDLSGKELYEFTHYRESMGGAKYNPDEKRRIFNVAFFSKGLLIVQSNKVSSEESIHLLERFAAVFEQTYTRFLDLQKAEAQAREAQIEAAMERIRSKAMAMQTSGDLNSLVSHLFEEASKLNFVLDRCIVTIIDPQTLNSTWVLSNPETPSEPTNHFVQYHEHKPYLRMIEAWQNRIDKWEYVLEGEEKKSWDQFLFYKTGLAKLPSPAKEGMQKINRIQLNSSFSNFGNITLSSFEALDEKQFDILIRFTKVFDLTYTRFNDLKQAEAQAREAQIELSLERVRAKTMAMHNSEDVADTVATMLEELVKLGIETVRCGIGIMSDTWQMEAWTARSVEDGKAGLVMGRLNMTMHPLLEGAYNGWKNKEESFSYELRGDDLVNYYTIINDHPAYPIKYDISSLPPEIHHNDFYFAEGSLYVFSKEQLPAETKKIFKRFAAVFGQTYRRYLDLQKAEAQAREAQIEASLERVRARTMAMHNSEDVSEATATMFIELKRLNIQNFRGGILTIKSDQTMDVWSANTLDDGRIMNAAGGFDMTMHPFWQQLYEGWKNKIDSAYFDMSGKVREDYVSILNARHDYLPNGIQLPDCHVQSYFFGEGAVWTFSLQPHSEEQKQIMKRFASVFSLTFRRYQDLKKAEAQAREGQIEAALERVRTSAMAMQKSNDLFTVAEVLWEQLKKLGQPELESSIVHLYNNDQPTFDAWYAYCPPGHPAHEMITGVAKTSKSSTAWAREVIANYQSPKTTYTISASGEKLSEWYKEVEKVAPAVIDYDENGQIIVPKILYYHFSKFSGGALLMISIQQPSPEACDLHKRAAVVFDLAYTRFSDLQIAEASAKEAVKQAALDRIRADIASMRTISDLDRITPLIWNELTILGIPFIRCGVFIMDEKQQLIHTFLSNPEGKAIAAFHLPYDTPGNLSKVLSHWKEHKIYIDHWDHSAFTEMAAILVNQGAIATPGQYLDSIPHGGFYLHFLPFLQGMLYAGNTTQLADDDIKLLQSVADTFSTAYARYEDFNKLETAKQQVEKTLTDLKQAQTQLVQSEKMASLGELTAGIAHEIQNPLNFVNNFSDVSNELLDEMKEELAKGNIDDAIAIAEDVKQNLEKINHHGKRADGIVKGMLQHSRSSSGQKEMTDINILADEYLRLAYHGLRAKDKSFNAKFETHFDDTIDKINIIPQDIGRVILNLINNAFYAAPLPPEGGFREPDGKHIPTVWVSTKKEGNRVLITVKDNGPGISQNIIDKIFQPFFTTKPTGQGTGLGLSLSYDIVKAHGGKLKVETKEGEGSEFIIQLPA